MARETMPKEWYQALCNSPEEAELIKALVENAKEQLQEECPSPQS